MVFCVFLVENVFVVLSKVESKKFFFFVFLRDWSLQNAYPEITTWFAKHRIILPFLSLLAIEKNPELKRMIQCIVGRIVEVASPEQIKTLRNSAELTQICGIFFFFPKRFFSFPVNINAEY